MYVVFLMGGQNSQKDTDNYPLYLTELNGKLILERQIEACRTIKDLHYVFCLKEADCKSYQLNAVISQIEPAASVLPIAGTTKGAVCTALLASGHVEWEEELLLLAIDDLVDISMADIIKEFRAQYADAGVVSFPSVHPRYSFARLNTEGTICEVAEKKPISKHALVSFYYFKKAGDFIECAKEVIRKDNPVNNAFYISQTLNEMILLQKKVVLYPIASEAFHPLKTEAQLAQYVTEFQEQQESK